MGNREELKKAQERRALYQEALDRGQKTGRLPHIGKGHNAPYDSNYGRGLVNHYERIIAECNEIIRPIIMWM